VETPQHPAPATKRVDVDIDPYENKTLVYNKRGQGKRRNETMTDFQFRKLLLMVIAILEKSSSLDDALVQLRKLAAKESEE